MAANLGQAFLGAAGMVPTIAQELAAGNFPDSRESFHDYIYSKLILGEDKGNNPNTPNPPVFPNTNLASSYPNPLSGASHPYNPGTSSNMQDMSGGLIDSKAFSNQTIPKAQTAMKSGSPKKKSTLAQPKTTHISPEASLTKVKKKSHHKKKEKTNVCDVCGRGFAEKYTLNRHMLTHTHIKPYSCTKCNMAFSRSDGLAKHMAAGHRRIDAHHCDVCGGTFNSEVSYEQHRREYGNTLPFVCNLCMLAFSQCCHLNYHMKSHSLNKMNDSLGPDSQDNKHETIDVSELIPDDFSTPKKDSHKETAGFLYSPGASAGHLMSALVKNSSGHMLKTTDALGLLDPNIVIKPEIEDMPTCSGMNSRISAANLGTQGTSSGSITFDALSHLTSVSSATINLSLSNRAVNQSVHVLQGNTSASSSYLPDSVNSSNLNSNAPSVSDLDMKKYFDIKIPNPKLIEGLDLQSAGVGDDGLFRCGLCGKGFTRKYHMQRHVKLHTRGPVPRAHLLDWTRRPYACGVCKMGFTRQHHLTRHMLIHTGERPHSCHVCGKAFRRFTNLSLHVRTVHGAERPFKCHICGRGFPRLYSLQRHHKLHAKHAAGLSSEAVGQLYKGFKAVGTVIDHLAENRASTYASNNPASLRQSPGHSRESISSDHSDDSERYGPESSTHDDRRRNVEPERKDSPLTQRESYSQVRERSTELGFSPQAGHRLSNNDQQPSMGGQEERLVSVSGQVLQSRGSEFMVQHNALSHTGNQGLTQQTQSQSRNSSEVNCPAHQGNESTRGQKLSQSSQPAMQHTTERFNTPNNLPNHHIPSLDIPVSRSFSEMDLRDTHNYSLGQNQRGNPRDGFSISQQRIQSPLSSMNLIERPGSGSILSQQGRSDKYISTSAGYSQLQQSSAARDQLSTVRTTISPAGLADSVNFSHSRHIELGLSHGGVAEQPAYSHSHLQFPSGSHSLYQVPENLLHQPNPSASSPMPVHSHNNNIQY